MARYLVKGAGVEGMAPGSPGKPPLLFSGESGDLVPVFNTDSLESAKVAAYLWTKLVGYTLSLHTLPEDTVGALVVDNKDGGRHVFTQRLASKPGEAPFRVV
jgi:hypothetical protein